MSTGVTWWTLPYLNHRPHRLAPEAHQLANQLRVTRPNRSWSTDEYRSLSAATPPTAKSPHTLAPSALTTCVLSIGKLGQGQANYYLESVAQGIEDYYTGAGEAPGRWLGSAARELGMGGEVEDDDLHAVLNGL